MNTMKSNILFSAGCGLLATALLLLSCEKKVMDRLAPEQTDFTNSTLLQFYNGRVGSNRTYVYVDGAPVNGATITYGVSFPNTAAAAPGTTTPYSFVVPAGIRGFAIRDTATVTTQLPLLFSNQFQANSNYTIFAYDTITSPKQKTVLTPIQIPTDGTARLRMANFIFSKTPVPAVDLYSVKVKNNLFTNVAIEQVTDFAPYTPVFNDTLVVFNTGTKDTLAKFNAFNAIQRRSYTLVFRGRYQSTSGTPARTLSAFANY